jgi:hypothetical protein
MGEKCGWPAGHRTIGSLLDKRRVTRRKLEGKKAERGSSARPKKAPGGGEKITEVNERKKGKK